MTKRLVLSLTAVLLVSVVAAYFLFRPDTDRNPNAGSALPIPGQRERMAVTAGPPARNVARAPVVEPLRSPSEAETAQRGGMPSALLEPKRTEPAAPEPVEEVTGPADELENVQFMVRGFRDALGENPVGNNLEITKALLGDNTRQVKMPLPVGSRLNDQGELTDRWGSPYFFHQLSAKEMEIRSAGPDRRMWTSDDLLAR